jgi:[ribosomal protein S5]-alanine N-acetyltransferase
MPAPLTPVTSASRFAIRATAGASAGTALRIAIMACLSPSAPADMARRRRDNRPRWPEETGCPTRCPEPLPDPLPVPAAFMTKRLHLLQATSGGCRADLRGLCHGSGGHPLPQLAATPRFAETHAYLAYCDAKWAAGRSFPFVIETRQDPALIGMIHLRDHGHRVSSGYVSARAHWGRGYVAEALSCLVDWVLAQPRIYPASASCDVRNRASARVMEKAGMVHEGLLRRYPVHPSVSPEPQDVWMHARTR